MTQRMIARRNTPDRPVVSRKAALEVVRQFESNWPTTGAGGSHLTRTDGEVECYRTSRGGLFVVSRPRRDNRGRSIRERVGFGAMRDWAPSHRGGLCGPPSSPSTFRRIDG